MYVTVGGKYTHFLTAPLPRYAIGRIPYPPIRRYEIHRRYTPDTSRWEWADPALALDPAPWPRGQF